MPSGSSSSQPPSPETAVPSAGRKIAADDQGKVPSAPNGKSHGRQRSNGMANVTAAITSGNRISR